MKPRYNVNHRPRPQPPQEFLIFYEIYSRSLDYEGVPEDWQMLEITLPNNGTPIRDRLQKLVAREHPGYNLATWWIPEPVEEF